MKLNPQFSQFMAAIRPTDRQNGRPKVSSHIQPQNRRFHHSTLEAFSRR
jgi:hypothetical protein